MDPVDGRRERISGRLRQVVVTGPRELIQVL
jgi:hypothetical protein